jgi:hypothetical protein
MNIINANTTYSYKISQSDKKKIDKLKEILHNQFLETEIINTFFKNETEIHLTESSFSKIFDIWFSEHVKTNEELLRKFNDK